jgi:hypothetical protein
MSELMDEIKENRLATKTLKFIARKRETGSVGEERQNLGAMKHSLSSSDLRDLFRAIPSGDDRFMELPVIEWVKNDDDDEVCTGVKTEKAALSCVLRSEDSAKRQRKQRYEASIPFSPQNHQPIPACPGHMRFGYVSNSITDSPDRFLSFITALNGNMHLQELALFNFGFSDCETREIACSSECFARE